MIAQRTSLKHAQTSSVLDYLIPERRWLALVLGVVAILMTVLGMAIGQPLWRAALPGTFLFTAAGLVRWYHDRSTYGQVIALMVALLTFQGGHGLEHLAQWVQYHLLGYTARASSGLISAANSEWVHFVWNWGVLAVMLRILAPSSMEPLTSARTIRVVV